MGDVDERDLVVGGILLKVYGSAPTFINKNSQGLAIMFLLHGRFGQHLEKQMTRSAREFVSYAQSQLDLYKEGKDLVVVTFDQRNHGDRTVDATLNKGWKDRPKDGKHGFDNPTHAVDMYAIQTGTARDVSFLIDFIGSALYPSDERHITDWYVAGISLGGHSTWLSIAHETRISLAIPIIGSPDTYTLLSNRARSTPPPLGPLPIKAPYFPTALLNTISKLDPCNVPAEIWQGKKILILSGEKDELVNYVKGGTEKFVENTLRAVIKSSPGGKLDVWIQPDAYVCGIFPTFLTVAQEGEDLMKLMRIFIFFRGHQYTPEMAQKACQWLWEEALAAPSPSSAVHKSKY